MRKLNPDGVKNEIIRLISDKLDSIGLMYRIFARTKTQSSLSKKLNSDSNYGDTKKIQDLIGVRVVLYFNDDIRSVRSVISSLFEEKSNDVSIDEVGKEEFRAVRYNIIYSLDEELNRTLNLGDEAYRIDSTFELQIRTIFSEGWHEIEHDLRYKCKDDWSGFDGESRLLNGVYAALENSEWTMIKIFDELAYSHYKSQQWSAMLRQKLRMRFIEDDIRDEILNIFNQDQNLAKKFFRIDREALINRMSEKGYFYPITINNIIYFANLMFIADQRITDLTPEMMANDMS